MLLEIACYLQKRIVPCKAGVIASLQALEPLLRQVPAGVQAQMAEPASDLHADLNGLLFTAFLFANIHPNADDYDVG